MIPSLVIVVGQVTGSGDTTLGGLCRLCGGETILAGLVMAPDEIALGDCGRPSDNATGSGDTTLGGLCWFCGGDIMLAGLIMGSGRSTLVGTVMISGGDVGGVRPCPLHQH